MYTSIRTIYVNLSKESLAVEMTACTKKIYILIDVYHGQGGLDNNSYHRINYKGITTNENINGPALENGGVC